MIQVYKTVRTGLYGRTAKDVLDWTIGCMTCVGGETTVMARQFMRTSTTCEGEVVVEFKWDDRINTHAPWTLQSCRLLAGGEQRAAGRLADKLKTFVKQSACEWKRDGRVLVSNFSTADAYAVYDALKGRGVGKRYSAVVVERVVFHPRDPMSAELEAARREELARLDAEEAAERKRLIKEYADRRKAIHEQLRECDAAADKAEEELVKKYRRLRDEANLSFADVQVSVQGRIPVPECI